MLTAVGEPCCSTHGHQTVMRPRYKVIQESPSDGARWPHHTSKESTRPSSWDPTIRNSASCLPYCLSPHDGTLNHPELRQLHSPLCWNHHHHHTAY